MDDDYRKYGTSRAAHIVIEDKNKCFVCGGYVPDTDINCPGCGFPQNGDEMEQRRFLGELRAEKREEQINAYRVGHGLKMLLVLPAILFLLALEFWKNEHDIFLAIGIFGRNKPFLAFAITLGLYALITIPVFYEAPKIIIDTNFLIITPYIYLPYGMWSYKSWQIMDKDLQGKNTG